MPLGFLGFSLCLLYRLTKSLYPCIATHSINNSIAFGDLEGWSWDTTLLLLVGALATIALVALLLRAVGLISPEPRASALIAEPG